MWLFLDRGRQYNMHHTNEKSPEECMKTILDLQLDQHRTGAGLSATSHPGMPSDERHMSSWNPDSIIWRLLKARKTMRANRMKMTSRDVTPNRAPRSGHVTVSRLIGRKCRMTLMKGQFLEALLSSWFTATLSWGRASACMNK